MRKPRLAHAASSERPNAAPPVQRPISPALLVLLLILCAASASAQPLETVTVDANALVGVWKISLPIYGEITFGGPKWGTLSPHYCRIEQSADGLTANCFPAPIPDGTASVEKGHFHLAWGTMLARFYFDGNMTSAETFEGHNGLKLTGMAVENPALEQGEKLHLSPVMPDTGGKAALLNQVLADIAGGRTTTIDAKSTLVQLPKGAILRGLGMVENILYLGAAPKPLPPNSKETPQPEFFRVYDVEFSNGHRICGLHQTDDGTIDGLRCV